MNRLILILALLIPTSAAAQIDAFNGYCTQGSFPVLTSGLPSSNLFQNLIPQCKVTVYLTGTTILATVYQDAAATPLTNPFTASTKSQWLFFAADNQGYDVVMSGGIPPLTYTIPVTLTDLIIKSGGGGVGPVIQTNNVPNISQTLLNFVNPTPFNGLTFTFLNPSGGIETFAVGGTLNNPGITNPYTTVNGQVCVLGATCTIPVGTTLTLEHNDSTTGINQSVLDFNDTNPAPPSGKTNVTFQTDSTGRLSGYVPAAFPPLLQYGFVPPDTNQGVLLHFNTCVFTTSPSPTDLVEFDACDGNGGLGQTFPGGLFDHVVNLYFTFSNPQTLPSYIIPANITKIFILSRSNAWGIGSAFNCGSGPNNQQVNFLYTTSGSVYPSITCQFQLNQSVYGTFGGGSSELALWVEYTGSAPPPSNVLNVYWPLEYISATNSLDISQYWPNGVNQETVAQLNSSYPASQYPGYVGAVSDLALPTGTATGGGTGQGWAVSNGSSYQALQPYFGIPQGSSVVCPSGPNGTLSNVNCNTGATSPPTIVSSGAMNSAPTCTSGAITLTAGNTLVVYSAGGTSVSDTAGDTFTNIYNLHSGYDTAWIASNIVGGTTTINSTPSCSGLWIQIAGAATSPLDGTPATAYLPTAVPQFYTIGNANTNAGNDLLLAEGQLLSFACSGSLNGPYTTLAGYATQLFGYGVGAGSGSYNATFVAAPGCARPGQNSYSLIAIKSATGGSSGVISVSNSDSTLTISPTTGSVIASLNLAHANTWSAVQTISPANGLVLSAMTGTSCLEEIAGVVTATGAACGSGSGSVGGSGTAGFLPIWTATTTLGNSLADYNVSNANAFTFAAPVDINAASSPSEFTLTYNSGHPPSGSSGSAVLAPDVSGNLDLSDNNGSLSPVCTPANGFCSTASLVGSAEVVSFSATPTFSSAFNVSRIVLTGNITSFTMGGSPVDGQLKTLCFKQGTGPYTVVPPAAVHGFFTVGTINADWNCQAFVWDNTDSIWQATTPGTVNQ